MILIAQTDDPQILEWLGRAAQFGGSFVASIARAGLTADHENYPALRPFLLQLRAKYPQYEPSAAERNEIDRRSRFGRCSAFHRWVGYPAAVIGDVAVRQVAHIQTPTCVNWHPCHSEE